MIGLPDMAETINCMQPEPGLRRETDPCTSVLPESRTGELTSLYMTWLHRQPLVMFDTEKFAESLPGRDPELILALQALCLRFPPQSLNMESRQRLIAMARTSRQLVMDKVFRSQVDLSVLQTLCLLSLFEYTEGNVAQAGLHLNMAIQFVRGIPKGNVLGDAVEFNDCLRSIFVLYHLQGSVSPSVWPLNTSHGGNDPTDSWPGSGWLTPPDNVIPCAMDAGILKYTTPLAQVWREARIYASCRVLSDVLPPWNPRSDYSQITYRHLEVDCSVPMKYRFSASRIEEQTSDSLQQNRHHWGPYLFAQFIYASIPVILNHPFLLSMRLRHFRSTMPHSFINSSFDAITRHIGWIMYHLELINRMAYQISDPTLAHVIVIVATIHLQHSFVEDHSLREKAQSGFRKCLEFLQRMGTIWPMAGVMHDNLQKLQQSIQVVSVPSQDPELSGTAEQKFTIDTRLLWDLLCYEKAGRPDAHADQSMFSGLLSTDQDNGSGTDYDLVGSAGIIGHKTVPKDTPIYAPGEETLQQNIRHKISGEPLMSG
ncbi:zn(ii)2cys6 transcription factor [Fusarium flagelliforme]|uniref:Zn(Ii)2cys6 transcription factor n=1 Tax=Fusarium flagelliforme TaxID=2675880 RepID=A0A395N1P3_9HYPO|nr:zn(ii)2cys6 transcription factor [Fusarium flagelliforme]